MLIRSIYFLYGFFAITRTYTRYALVRTPDKSSAATRPHGHLECLNLVTWLSLATAFFLEFNLGGNWQRATLIVLALVVYDWTVRWAFLEWAVRRLCRSSSKITRRSALHQVHRIAGYAEPSPRLPRSTARADQRPVHRKPVPPRKPAPPLARSATASGGV